MQSFSEATATLNAYEIQTIVPLLVEKFKQHKGQGNAIKNKQLIAYCYANGIRLSEPRIRKIVEYIRQHELITGLIAKQFGYFLAENPEEILRWVGTMIKRRDAIDCSIAKAMESYDALLRTDNEQLNF